MEACTTTPQGEEPHTHPLHGGVGAGPWGVEGVDRGARDHMLWCDRCSSLILMIDVLSFWVWDKCLTLDYRDPAATRHAYFFMWE